MIHCRAIAHDKQSIGAQIILADENPRLSSLPCRRSDLTARYLPMGLSATGALISPSKKKKKRKGVGGGKKCARDARRFCELR